MLVVSDSSPLNILVRVEQIQVLPKLFSSVIIPKAVADELSKPTTPEAVRFWLASAPSWLSVLQPKNAVDPSKTRHRGERDAIALAIEIKADAILLDEPKPRRDAAKENLLVVGTIGVLERAANDRLVDDLESIYQHIKATDFRIDHALLDESLKRHLLRIQT